MKENSWRGSLRWFAAEFAVVVSGILVALALQAWWSSRQDRATELRLLQQMLVDLQRDSALLSRAALRDSLSSVTTEFTAKKLDARAPYSPVMAAALNGVGDAHTLSLHTAQYETLKSRGLDIITNDSLRTAISAFFEETVPSQEKQNEWLRTAESRWMLVIMRLFRPTPGATRQLEPRNYAALFTDSEFRMLLDEYMYYMRYVRPWKRSVGTDLNRLMAEVRRELDAREPHTRGADAPDSVPAAVGASAPDTTALGCYVLRVGEYKPDVGADRKYFLPPDTVELTTDSATARNIKARAVRPGLVANGPPGLWRTRGDTIQMAWTDGTTGVTISVLARGDTLFGVARPISDVVVPDGMRPSAAVSAARIACRGR